MVFPTITSGQLDQYIDAGRDMLLIDLRNSSSYRHCHIRGAVNIPYPEIEARRAELPKDRLLVFYCSRGGQSMMVCRLLSRQGYQVADVAGGVTYYRGKYLVFPETALTDTGR